MAFKVRYFRGGDLVSEVWSDKPLPNTRETVMDALARYGADYAAILDLEDGDKLVETVKYRA